MTEHVCTVVVAPRDRFSSTEDCLENLRAHTPEPHALIVVIGGAPEEYQRRLREPARRDVLGLAEVFQDPRCQRGHYQCGEHEV